MRFLIFFLLILPLSFWQFKAAPNSSAWAQVESKAKQEQLSVEGDSLAGSLRSALPIPVQVEPKLADLDQSQGQQWRRCSYRLAGSMCPSCLLELEGKLRRLPGVAFAAIVRDGQPGSEVNKPRTAMATVVYNGVFVSGEQLKACIKFEKYKPLDSQDSLLSASR